MQITAGPGIVGLLAVPLSPIAGLVVDRWGSRGLAILGMALTGAVMAGFALANGSVAQWIGLWCLYGIVATGVQSTVWTAAVSGAFNASRGLALGVTMAGAAAAQVVTPPLTNWLIETQGWRAAYVWLGAGWGGLGLVLLLLFFRDRRRTPAKTPSLQEAEPLPGLAFREALRTPAILRVGLSTVITIFLGIAFLVHQVPILTEAGVSRGHAAFLASLTGLAGLAGKLVTGTLVDRWRAGLVGGITLATPAIAFIMLLEPFRGPLLISIAMFIIGYSAGAKLQVSAYLISRYAGRRNFGKIFGVIASLIAIASSLGPLAAGALYDATGSYTALVAAGIPGSLLCGLLILGLGPFPDWSAKAAASRKLASTPSEQVA
jgi:MFS family permease